MQEILDTLARMIEQRTKEAEQEAAAEARAALLEQVLEVVDEYKSKCQHFLDNVVKTDLVRAATAGQIDACNAIRTRLAALDAPSPAPEGGHPLQVLAKNMQEGPPCIAAFIDENIHDMALDIPTQEGEEIWEFVEPHLTGGDSVVRISRKRAIEYQRIRMQDRYTYENDDDALQDFITTNLAYRVTGG